MAFVETANLDGETNLKLRQPLPETQNAFAPPLDQSKLLEEEISEQQTHSGPPRGRTALPTRPLLGELRRHASAAVVHAWPGPVPAHEYAPDARSKAPRWRLSARPSPCAGGKELDLEAVRRIELSISCNLPDALIYDFNARLQACPASRAPRDRRPDGPLLLPAAGVGIRRDKAALPEETMTVLCC